MIFSLAGRLQRLSVLDIVGDHDQVLGRKSCSRSHTGWGVRCRADEASQIEKLESLSSPT